MILELLSLVLAVVEPITVNHNRVKGDTPIVTNMVEWVNSKVVGGLTTNAVQDIIVENVNTNYLASKAYVDGIAVVIPAVVTNIANYRVDAKVAAWAMKGQPKPTTDLTGMTNFVRGVAQSGTNYTDAVADNYLPLDGSKAMPGSLLFSNGGGVFSNDGSLCLYSEGKPIEFGDDIRPSSFLTVDSTPVMTEGKADYHIVSNATVKSGQIANIDLTGLTNKTITVSFSTDNGKAGDALLWTAGNTADCTMTFSSPLTPHGDDGYLKASANKKCLFMFSKVSATDIIITKKEIEQ